MNPSRRPSARTPFAWLLVLGVALAIGGAAMLLTASANAPPPAPAGPTSLVFIGSQTLLWVGIAITAVLIGIVVIGRLLEGGIPLPSQFIAAALVLVLVLVLLVVILRVVGGGGTLPTSPGQSEPGNSSLQNRSNPSGPNLTGSGGSIVVLGLSLPPWALFVLVAAVGVVVAAIAVRVGAVWYAERRAETPILPVAEVRRLLASADADLEAGLEPRAVLIRLYGLLLARLGPFASDLESETAEEIRTLHLLRLGIEASTAADITQLFEEARYSSHPIGPAELVRARSAIRAAIDELDARREALA